MKHDLQWFADRRGRTIIMRNEYAHEERLIALEDDDIDYRRRHLYQDCGYTFRDQVRVHSGPPESACVSCEG
ncbi:hypothetical protein ACRDNQ_04100 [Palleronia sp. KMU-117]|uniref:hypothetical protein n=1 Tax=Palleronia sp. KMU-117 TaxID=3434108 RepID=UPI003D7136B8